MTREFEKYFPLPLSYDAVRGEIKTYGGIVVMQPSLGLMSNEQAEYADDFARHLATCANFMPEAVEALKTACKALEMIKGSSFCETCDDNELCEYCDVQIALKKAVSFLAKLEGGGGDA